MRENRYNKVGSSVLMKEDEIYMNQTRKSNFQLRKEKGDRKDLSSLRKKNKFS